MRKMKIETTIANLKKMLETYKEEVSFSEQEFERVSKKLAKYRDLVAQVQDALDALEGRPTLKQQLQEALQPRTEPLGVAVGDATSCGGSLPSGLSPAEPGMKWVLNFEGEAVLVAETLQTSFHSETPLIELPPISDDEKFGDKPTDFII